MFFTFFVRQIFGRLFVYGYLGLRESQIPGGKTKNKKTPFVKLSTGAHRTRVHFFQATISKKTAWTLPPLCGKRARFTALPRNYFVLIMGSTSGVQFDLILCLRSQFLEYLCTKKIQACFGVPAAGSISKKAWGKKRLLPPDTPDWCWLFLRPVVGWDTASPLVPQC